jgi:hypothetical protein
VRLPTTYVRLVAVQEKSRYDGGVQKIQPKLLKSIFELQKFPPDGHRALIPIVPIDSGSNNLPKTVILTPAPSTNKPPDYLVGFPPCAEVIILYGWPRPLPLLLPDGSFCLDASGPDGAWFCIQNSSDLLNWSSVITNQAFQGSVDYIDPNAPSKPSGFYRVVPLTNLPPQ